jgi:hypothetical protein
MLSNVMTGSEERSENDMGSGVEVGGLPVFCVGINVGCRVAGTAVGEGLQLINNMMRGRSHTNVFFMFTYQKMHRG